MLEVGFKPKEHQQDAIQALKKYRPNHDLDKFGKPIWKKQYLFVGATIPSKGTRNVQRDIFSLFPMAEIISTETLHKPISSVKHEWIEIKTDERFNLIIYIIRIFKIEWKNCTKS